MAAAQARNRPEGDPPAQSRRGRRVSLQGRVRHRLGQIRLQGMPRGRLRRDRLRRAARKAEGGARRRPLVRHRHRVLCRADRHRLAHLGRARACRSTPARKPRPSASIRPARSRPRSASPRTGRGWRRRWRRSSPSISARASRTSAIVQGDSAAVPGGTGTYASRSLVLAGGAAHACGAGRAREGAQRRLASARSRAGRSRRRRRPRHRSPAPTARSAFREVARAVYSEMGRLPAEAREELAATKTYDPVFGTTTSATHIATR